MKAPSLGYVRPTSLGEALEQLSGEDAMVLAGGQSLVASLNMRLCAPRLLVDINRIAELEGIDHRGDLIRIGALARHADVARSALIASRLPLLAMAVPHVAHPAIRNRGTTCGSLALADPVGEMPACAVALGARIVLASRQGRREVAARAFFQGLYQTAIEPGEMIVEALYPVARPDEVFGFDELTVRHGDFAVVGVAARAVLRRGTVGSLDLVVFASEPKPLLSAAARELAEGRAASADLAARVADAVAREMSPMASHQGRSNTKRRQATVLVRRVLARMFGGAADA